MSRFGVPRRQLVIGLISAALLSYQLALLQLLATSQWYHFAYLVVSVALLGFGVAGTALTLARDWFAARFDSLLPLSLLSCALCLLLPLLASVTLFGQFDSYLLFVSLAETAKLVLVALLLLCPFACGALAVGLIFTVDTGRIGGYYCANLLGSGLGCFLGLAGLELLFPEQLMLICALLAWFAGMLVFGSGERRRTVIAGGIALLLIVVCPFLPPPQLSQYKDLRRTLALPDAEVIHRRPGADGQVHLVQAPQLRSGTAVSLNWRRPIPPAQAVFSNGDRVGSLPLILSNKSPDDASTLALPYAITRPQTVLVLDAGTGEGVRQALRQGALKITAVDPRTTLLNALRTAAPERFGEMIADPRVDWQTSASRTWLARGTEQYDLIVLPKVGSFGGNSGLYALNEQPLLTREALQQAYRRLQPDGMLAVTVWLDYPTRKPLRLLATLVEVLEQEGGMPRSQLATVRSWGTLTFCLKRSAFTAAELSRIRGFAERWGVDPMHLPDLAPSERQRYHRVQDERLFGLFDQILSVDRGQLYRDYLFRLAPATDDRPFFAQFLRWERLGDLSSLYGQRTLPFVELGIMVAGVAALVLLLLALVLILLPLLRLPKGEGGLGATLCYFSGLGLGYIWLELVLIHMYSFYLGQPILALALVVGVLLIGSGCGSMLSDKLSTQRPGQWAGLVVVLICGYALVLAPAQQLGLPFDLSLRVLLGGLVLVPLALAMGLPFPLGLRRLSERQPALVPWAWGINSCLSVIGAAAATLIAVELGFQLMILLSASAYLLPLVTGWSRHSAGPVA